MIKISNVANSVHLSLVRSLFNEAKQYEDVIDFTLGDPDIHPHQAIKDAACLAIQEGKTRYSQNAGLYELRCSIGEYYRRKENQEYSPDTEIMVTVGAMEALYLSLLSTIDPGDEVIIPAPYYVNYVQMVRMCGGIPIVLDDVASKNLMFDIDSLRASVNERTKVIIINNPSNPTGRIIPEDILRTISEIATQNNLLVISDEVYKCLIYDGKKFSSIVNYKGMRERTLLVNSLSKEFCMTGYRLGYILGPGEVVSAMTRLQENIAACAPLPSQHAAIAALNSSTDYSSNMVRVFTERRRLLYEGLNRIRLLKPILPEATFYMMVDISKTGMKSIDFCYSLLRKAHVAVVPGAAYGRCCDDFVRIAFTLDDTKIIEGVERIQSFIETLA